MIENLFRKIFLYGHVTVLVCHNVIINRSEKNTKSLLKNIRIMAVPIIDTEGTLL